MNKELVDACQMFLVPATILFAALGLAASEALKTLLSLAGLAISVIWLIRLWRWTGLPDADLQTACALAGVFFLAAFISTVVHFRLWHKEWKGRGPTGFLDSLR